MPENSPTPPVASAGWRRTLPAAALLLALAWLALTPAGLLGKADAIGYAVCHRIDLRSFHLGERQLPLCARCSGMYLGALAGLAYQALAAPRAGRFPPRRLIAVLLGLAAAFAVDGLNSAADLAGLPTLYPPSNLLRLLTGSGMGLGMAAALYPAFNQTAWSAWSDRPALPGWKALAQAGGLALFIDLLVWSENPLLLYPLALLSAFGVLAILGMVYSMVWLMIFRAENRLQRLSQLGLPLAGGLALALLQLGLIDLGRFLLTGTWQGFPPGFAG
jgi:uncharacterized membrane protein